VTGHPVISAPAGLAATLASAAIATGGATTSALTGIALFMNTKLVTAGVSALVAFGLGIYSGHDRTALPSIPPPSAISASIPTITALQAQNDRLRADVARLNENLAQLNAARAVAAVGPSSPQANPLSLNRRALVTPQLLAYQQQHAMINNLRQFAAAAQQFRLENDRWPNSIDEVVGETKYIRRVLTVDGEDYSGLRFRDGAKLVVTSADGITATVDFDTEEPEGVLPSPAAELAQELGQKVEPAAKKALESYRAANPGAEPRNLEALLPYFISPHDAADFVEYLNAAKVARVN
jgi:hypothetical protein